jgi:hypothetical protein
LISLTYLSFGIGILLLLIPSNKHNLASNIQEKLLDNPDPGIRTKDIDCSRWFCDYYNNTEHKCKKPWNDYCGYI